MKLTALVIGFWAAVFFGSVGAQEKYEVSPWIDNTGQRYEICVLEDGVGGSREGLEFQFTNLPPGVAYKVAFTSGLIGPCPPLPLPVPIGERT